MKMTNEKTICTGIKSKVDIITLGIITAISCIVAVVQLVLIFGLSGYVEPSDFRTIIFFFVIAVILLIMLFAISKSEITVTDKRVYGKGAFGKRVDLPIHQISAVSLGMFSAVSVATSSGKVVFLPCQTEMKFLRL